MKRWPSQEVYEADVLLVHLGWNDLGQYGPEGLPYKRREKGYELSVPEHIVSRSYAIRLVYQLQRIQRRTKPTVNEPLSAREFALYESYTPHHFYKNLRRIVRLGKARYPNVYLVTLASITDDDPTPDELARTHFPVGMNKNLRKLHRLVKMYNDAVRTVAQEEGVGLIDLNAAFSNRAARKLFLDSCHVGSKGSRRMADVIVETIADAVQDADTASPSLRYDIEIREHHIRTLDFRDGLCPRRLTRVRRHLHDAGSYGRTPSLARRGWL